MASTNKITEQKQVLEDPAVNNVDNTLQNTKQKRIGPPSMSLWLLRDHFLRPQRKHPYRNHPGRPFQLILHVPLLCAEVGVYRVPRAGNSGTSGCPKRDPWNWHIHWQTKRDQCRV